MNLQLILPDELAQRLSTVAAKRGRAAENCAIELLDQSLPSMEKKQAVSKMLLAWADQIDEMSEEEMDVNKTVLQAIDEDRLSDRKLFTHLSS